MNDKNKRIDEIFENAAKEISQQPVSLGNNVDDNINNHLQNLEKDLINKWVSEIKEIDPHYFDIPEEAKMNALQVDDFQAQLIDILDEAKVVVKTLRDLVSNHQITRNNEQITELYLEKINQLEENIKSLLDFDFDSFTQVNWDPGTDNWVY